MPVTQTEWREKLRTFWRAWTDDPRGTLAGLGVESLYFAIAGSALYPVAAAIAQGDPTAGALLASVMGNVGANLIANVIQKEMDERALSEALVRAAERQHQIMPKLDAMMVELHAIEDITVRMKDDDLAWFRKKLVSERPELAMRTDVRVSNTGGGAIVVQGGVAVGRGVAIQGDHHGPINIGSTKAVRED